MKLSDVYKMYGSGGLRESSKPASHGRSFAVDAALAGACEVPSLPVCLCPDEFLSLCSPLCLSDHLYPSFHFHIVLLLLLVCC